MSNRSEPVYSKIRLTQKEGLHMRDAVMSGRDIANTHSGGSLDKQKKKVSMTKADGNEDSLERKD